METRIQIFHNEVPVGSYSKWKNTLYLGYEGEVLCLEYVCKKLKLITTDDIQEGSLSFFSTSTGRSNFAKEFVQSLNTKQDIIKGVGFRLISTQLNPGKCFLSYKLLENYLNGLYGSKYVSSNIGPRDIIVYDCNGEKLSNTSLQKAKKIILRDGGVLEGNILTLNHTIQSEIKYIPLLREELYLEQLGSCLCCGKKFNREQLQLHHKYIPQNILVINSRWNVELLCSKCHKWKHRVFGLVNILISCSEFIKTYIKKE